ncbi:hypothetical protein ACFZDJ_53170 [Streptomyces sp. NPDC007896]|uniref:hypothetical protein n=1 Tax=Streptomyces sp. NPDC007896 TaxID=3364784 RepID=UPI0036E480BC
MALEMIQDRPGREAVFEPLLDELLALCSPDRVLPERMVGKHQHHRCGVKRREIGRVAEADPGLTRWHADLLVHAAMHDQCRSGINQLVRPLVNALGYRWVQEEIIRYVRSGSEAEKVGATMAWYFARPPLKYASWEERIPTSESKAAVEALSDPRGCYRDAALAAFLSCKDSGVRQDLSLWVSLDPSVYPDDLQIAQKRAKDIILADPEHYRWLLQRSGHG